MSIATGLRRVPCVLLLALALCACRAQASAEPAPQMTEREWSDPSTPLGPGHVVVAVPRGASSKSPLPVLVALHGQGESRKTPAEGARGWLDDYRANRAVERLRNPPLYATDFQEMITAERLREINASLRERPFRGLILVTPYLPDRFKRGQAEADAAAYGAHLVEAVLPRVRRETPALSTAAGTGIDGVSLGGRASLLVGLGHPETFGAVSAQQPALGPRGIERIARYAERARRTNPRLVIRLLSSRRDRFVEVTRRCSGLLDARGIPHRLDVVEGDHSYTFNRGPGVYEMLLYHDRVLRQEKYL